MQVLLSARGEINRLPCVFAPALRARCAVCSLAATDDGKAGRIQCTHPLARAGCAALYGELRTKSRFALGLRPSPGRRLAPGAGSATLRVQGGGLEGLHTLLDKESHAIDIWRLLERLNALPQGLATLPWSELLRSIARWQPLRRSNKS